MQGEGTGAEEEISFEFHRQRFCYDQTTNMFEKLKYPTRVGQLVWSHQHACTYCKHMPILSYKRHSAPLTIRGFAAIIS